MMVIVIVVVVVVVVVVGLYRASNWTAIATFNHFPHSVPYPPDRELCSPTTIPIYGRYIFRVVNLGARILNRSLERK